MLRLTLNRNGPAEVIIQAEGRLVGEWAAVLEAECLRVLSEAPSIEIDMREVVDVDARGVGVLRRVRRGPVKLAGCTPIILALLAEEPLS